MCGAGTIALMQALRTNKRSKYKAGSQEHTCKIFNIVDDDYTCVCSECHKTISYFGKKNYCPNCGAKVVS